jgi:hypothetical protein
MTANHGIRDFGSFAETKTYCPKFLRVLNSGQLLHALTSFKYVNMWD